MNSKTLVDLQPIGQTIGQRLCADLTRCLDSLDPGLSRATQVLKWSFIPTISQHIPGMVVKATYVVYSYTCISCCAPSATLQPNFFSFGHADGASPNRC